MKKYLFPALFLLAMAIAVSGCAGPAKQGQPQAKQEQKAEDPAAYFKGKNIEFIVPWSSGGGYDAYARMVAPFLQKNLGATIVINNMPGGGSLVGTNHIYRAKPDGLTIGIINGMGVTALQITGAEGVQYDMQKFTVMGRVIAEPQLLSIVAKSPITSMSELIANKKQLNIGASGPGSNDYISALVFQKAFNLPLKIVTGYKGSAEIDLAMARGEIDLQAGSVSSRLSFIKSGEHRPLVLLGDKRDKLLPDVPTVLEFKEISQSGREIVEGAADLLEIGRLIVGPPGLPDNITKFLRGALDKTLNDPELLAIAEKSGKPLENAKPEDINNFIKKALGAPEGFKQLVKEASAKN